MAVHVNAYTTPEEDIGDHPHRLAEAAIDPQSAAPQCDRNERYCLAMRCRNRSTKVDNVGEALASDATNVAKQPRIV